MFSFLSPKSTKENELCHKLLVAHTCLWVSSQGVKTPLEFSRAKKSGPPPQDMVIHSRLTEFLQPDYPMMG
jgi:hypothetical protein